MDWNQDLHDGIVEEHLDSVLEAIRQGADVNGNTPDGDSFLTTAVNVGNLDVIRALLMAGANPNLYQPDSGTALTWAQDISRASLLVSHRARVRAEVCPRTYPVTTSVHLAAGERPRGLAALVGGDG